MLYSLNNQLEPGKHAKRLSLTNPNVILICRYSTAAAGARIIETGDEVGADFYNFLKSFLSVFEDLRDAEVYITGESYAGFYIPWIANHIVRHQLKMSPSDPGYINIQGKLTSEAL
jgi:carboxypeptidase C (cathepsin A)